MIEIQQNFNEYCAKPCRECELDKILNCESHYKAEALYNAGYRKQSEVAREIFEEIDILVDDWKHSRIQSIQFIAELSELKNKYTEVEK